jgi:ABC-type transport system substrate-binding protein
VIESSWFETKLLRAKATVEKLTFKIVPESAAREAMLKAGEIDICSRPSPANVAALKSDPNITVDMPLDTRTISIGLNCQKGATKNKLVRQAFNYAVDKKAIVRKVLLTQPYPWMVPAPDAGYHKMPNQYDYNPEKAKELRRKQASTSARPFTCAHHRAAICSKSRSRKLSRLISGL